MIESWAFWQQPTQMETTTVLVMVLIAMHNKSCVINGIQDIEADVYMHVRLSGFLSRWPDSLELVAR